MMNIANSAAGAAERADAGRRTAAGAWFAGHAADAGAADLRASVNGLVEALSSYSHAAPDATASALAQGARSSGIDMAACVAQLADSLTGFQQQRRGPAAALAAPGSAPGLPAWCDSQAARAAGWLAVVN